MNKKPRYAVMIDGDKTVYRGNSRFVAWTFWLINRHRKAIAYDCGIWVVEPAYWICVTRTEKSGRDANFVLMYSSAFWITDGKD